MKILRSSVPYYNEKICNLFLVSSLSVMILQVCYQKVGEDNTSQTGGSNSTQVETPDETVGQESAEYKQ